LGGEEVLKFGMVAGFIVKAGMIPFYALHGGDEWFILYYDKNDEVLRKVNPEDFLGKGSSRGQPRKNGRGWR